MNKTPLEILQRRAEDCIAATPVIILGSGASIAAGIPGMWELKEHLLSHKLNDRFASEDRIGWDKFLSLLQTTDLETALQKANLADHLDDEVVDATWQFLQPYDLKAFDDILRVREPSPLTRLFQHLLHSTNDEINVVTPNYDRLAEYAAEAGELIHETGFTHGYIRRKLGDKKQILQIGGDKQDRVNIWKVHGSFDWFWDEKGIISALPISHPKPDGWKPAIVTPGISKYRRVHDEPFVSVKAASDRACSNATAFFCSGFGFNDSHIQTKLLERCRSARVPIVLITRTLTEAAKRFFAGNHCKEYLAIERCDDGCRIFSTEFPEGEIISGDSYWQLQDFLTLVNA